MQEAKGVGLGGVQDGGHAAQQAHHALAVARDATTHHAPRKVGHSSLEKAFLLAVRERNWVQKAMKSHGARLLRLLRLLDVAQEPLRARSVWMDSVASWRSPAGPPLGGLLHLETVQDGAHLFAGRPIELPAMCGQIHL